MVKKTTAVCEGETSRSERLRGLEPIRGKNNKQSDNGLYKHQLKELEITGIFKDALSRQADESVRIYARQGHELMNSKSEFNHTPLFQELLWRRIQNLSFQRRLDLGCDNS